MKNINIYFLLFCIVIAGCKKETENITVDQPKTAVGILSVIPLGNPTDSFSYQVGSSESIQFTYYSGIVSSANIQIQLLSNSIYRVYYRDTTVNTVSLAKFGGNTSYYVRTDTIINPPDTNVVRTYHVQINHQTTSSSVNFTDNLPAMIY